MKGHEVPGGAWGLTIRFLPLTEPLLPAMPSSPILVLSLACRAPPSPPTTAQALLWEAFPEPWVGVLPCVPIALVMLSCHHLFVCLFLHQTELPKDRGLVCPVSGLPGSSTGLALSGYPGMNAQTDANVPSGLTRCSPTRKMTTEQQGRVGRGPEHSSLLGGAEPSLATTRGQCHYVRPHFFFLTAGPHELPR